MNRRVMLQGLVALAAACGEDRRGTPGAPASDRPAWTPASLAPLSGDQVPPPPIGLVLATRVDPRPGEALRRGFQAATPEVSVHTVDGGPSAIEDALEARLAAGARLLVVDALGDEAVIAKFAEQKRAPVLLLRSTDVRSKGKNEWIFFTGASSEKLGAAAARSFVEKKRIAVIGSDDTMGHAASEGLRKALARLGAPPPLLEARAGAVETLARHVKSVSVLKADALFAPLSRPLIPAFSAELARQGMDRRMVVGIDTMADAAPEAAEGIAFVTHYHADVDAKGNASLLAAVGDKAGRPTESMALGFDAGNIAKDALSRAKDDSREALREALAKTADVAVSTGTATFDAEGSPDRTVAVCRFTGGKIVLEGTASTKAG